MRPFVVVLLVCACEQNAVPTAEPPAVPAASVTSQPTETSAPSATEAVNTEASSAPSASSRRTQAPSPATPSASAKVEAKEVVGDKAVDSNFAAWLQARGPYAVGKPGNVQAVLVAKGEYKCNDKYPYKVTLAAAPEGVSYPDTTARSASKGTERTVVDVPFTASTPGNKTISGTFHFSVCNASSCKIAKRALSVTVAVQP